MYEATQRNPESRFLQLNSMEVLVCCAGVVSASYCPMRSSVDYAGSVKESTSGSSSGRSTKQVPTVAHLGSDRNHYTFAVDFN